MFYIKQQMGLTSSSEESLSSTAGASGSSDSASEPSPLSSKDSDPCSSNNRRWTINAYSQTKQTNKKKKHATNNWVKKVEILRRGEPHLVIVVGPAPLAPRGIVGGEVATVVAVAVPHILSKALAAAAAGA